MSSRTIYNILAIGVLLFTNNVNSYVVPPPAPENVALMARYIMHNSDWVSIATISTQDSIKGYPFVSLKSVSDGPKYNGTGVPYLYMTKLDVTGRDIEENNKVTLLATLAQSDYCRVENFDPQDPRCAKMIVTGKLKKLDNSTAEHDFAVDALFSRHPSMKNWPTDHGFYVATVAMEQIDVLDYYGGIKHVSLDDYFSANVTNLIISNDYIKEVSVVDIKAE